MSIFSSLLVLLQKNCKFTVINIGKYDFLSDGLPGLFVKKKAHVCIKPLVNVFARTIALLQLLAQSFCHLKKRLEAVFTVV